MRERGWEILEEVGLLFFFKVICVCSIMSIIICISIKDWYLNEQE